MTGKFIKMSPGRKRQLFALGTILAVFAVTALALALLGGGGKDVPGEKKTGGGIKILRGVDLAREKWRIEGEKRLGMLESGQKEMMRRLDSVSAAVENLEKGSSGDFRPRPAPKETEETVFPSPFPDDVPITPSEEKHLDQIRVFSPSERKTEESSRGTPGLSNWIPSGSFVPGVLLSGLDAPTGTVASRNPHPVLIHLDSLSRLPNSRLMDIEDCRVTGSAYGQLASERAYVRLERIACILDSGEVVDTEIKGYVTGEDGRTGIRGKLISKQGKLLFRGILAGFASGFGEAVETSNAGAGVVSAGTFTAVDRRTTGDLLKTGAGGGAGEAGKLLAEYYLKLAEEIFPVIEIDAGRKVDVVFTEGTELPPRKTSYSRGSG